MAAGIRPQAVFVAAMLLMLATATLAQQMPTFPQQVALVTVTLAGTKESVSLRPRW
jgi:hypothetical protein